MSQQNLELVTRVLGEAQHNPPALWDLLDDDVLWEPGQLDLPDAAPAQWHGPAGVQEFFRRWIGPFDEWGYEVGEMIDAGDSVVAHIHQWGRGKGSGAKVESQFWLVWTIRDGKLVRGTHYAGRAEALESAGLRAEDVMRRRLG
jgi:ketosteroid isomerase-like protein